MQSYGQRLLRRIFSIAGTIGRLTSIPLSRGIGMISGISLVEGLIVRQIWDSCDPEVMSLVAKSDSYLSALYPPQSNHAEPIATLMSEHCAFFGGYIGDQLVACAAVKLVEACATYGEVKRVFVSEDQRGKRFASKLMRHLEDFLLRKGVTIARLETGYLQSEAVMLYRKLGYVERGPFGSYVEDPLSVFMEKFLNKKAEIRYTSTMPDCR